MKEMATTSPTAFPRFLQLAVLGGAAAAGADSHMRADEAYARLVADRGQRRQRPAEPAPGEAQEAPAESEHCRGCARGARARSSGGSLAGRKTCCWSLEELRAQGGGARPRPWIRQPSPPVLPAAARTGSGLPSRDRSRETRGRTIR